MYSYMKKDDEILGLVLEVEQKMRIPREFRISDPAWRVTPRAERNPSFANFYRGSQYSLSRSTDSEGHTRLIYVDECVFYEDRLWLIIEMHNDGGKDTIDLHMLPENLLQPNEETAVWWNDNVPEVVERVLLDTLEHFKREDIANTELTIERNWSLAELERRFDETFEAELWIYDGGKRIHNDPRHIEELEGATNDTLIIRGFDQIGDIIKRLQEAIGFAVRIRDRRYGQTPPDILPLYVVRDAPRPRHDMEPLSK